MDDTDQTKRLVDEYIGFQSTAHSPFHVVIKIVERLQAQGFRALELDEDWNLSADDRAYIIHPDQKTVICIQVGSAPPDQAGFNLFGAHTDSPTLRLKMDPWASKDDCQILTTQKHGGLILRSWLDRPLLLAGAIHTIQRENNLPVLDALGRPVLKTRILQSSQAIGVIPDLAIHLDSKKNTNGELNAETAMQIITRVTSNGEESDLPSAICGQLGATPDQLDGFELSIAPYFPHTLVGSQQDLILGPRHDDLAMVFCGLEAFLQNSSRTPPRTNIAVFFDAEETGSTTASGAGSSFFQTVLAQITSNLSQSSSTQLWTQAMGHSFFVSADMAHAIHPAYESKHDQNHRPKINGGIVIKENANDRYATSGYSSSYFKAICERAQVPTQAFVARQDIGCGSTIGPITASKLGCHVVDIGTAMWAMHSSAETMGSKDLYYAWRAFSAFFDGTQV